LATLETLHRDKLPRGWSYPVGAEALSRHLGSVEGAATRPLRFSDYFIRSTPRRKLIEQNQLYRVLEVRYCRPDTDADRQLAAERGDQDQWEVSIDPVPSDKRAVLKAGLEASALPVVRAWLDETRRLAASQGRGVCRVLYDGGLNQIYVEQTLNSFEKPERVAVSSPGISGSAG